MTTAPHRLTLPVITCALAMIVSAVSGLNVALPSLAIDTGAPQTQITWIVDAYTLAFVGLLLPAGALGDRYGRKLALLAGVAIFGLAAAAAGFTSNPTHLIAIRAFMGVGAAFVMPTTLSVITASFPAKDRAKAVGLWVGVAGGGAVLGLFASGLLLQWFSWNSFFVLNVVLAAVTAVGAIIAIPPSQGGHRPRLDPVGAGLSLAGLVLLVYAIIEASTHGITDPLIAGSGLTGITLLVLFVRWELHRTDPMLDPRLFVVREFAAGSLVLTVQFFAAFGLFFTIMQYLQYVAGLSALMAATAMLPLPATLIPLARNAPQIAQRIGTRTMMTAGLLSSCLGLAILAQLSVDFRYWHMAIGLVFFAIGMGLAGTPATTSILAALPAAKQGVASAVNDTSRELGSAVGIAVLGSAINAVYRAELTPALTAIPAEEADKALSSIAFLHIAEEKLAALGPAGEVIVQAAQHAFVEATTTALTVGSTVVFLGALGTWFLTPSQGKVAVSHEPHEPEHSPQS